MHPSHVGGSGGDGFVRWTREFVWLYIALSHLIGDKLLLLYMRPILYRKFLPKWHNLVLEVGTLRSLREMRRRASFTLCVSASKWCCSFLLMCGFKEQKKHWNKNMSSSIAVRSLFLTSLLVAYQIADCVWFLKMSTPVTSAGRIIIYNRKLFKWFRTSKVNKQTNE